MRGCVRLQCIFFFFKTLSVHLPVSWWVISECTCPHCAECSAIFDQKQHDPHNPPSLFTWSHPKQLFLVSLGKKSPQRETFCWCGRGETINSRSTKRHQNQRVQNLFWAVGKMSQSMYCMKWRVLWRWLNFKHGRINTQFFINKFLFFGHPLIRFYLYEIFK